MSKLNNGLRGRGCDAVHRFCRFVAVSRVRENSAPETAGLFLCQVRSGLVNFDDSASSAFGNLFSVIREGRNS